MCFECGIKEFRPTVSKPQATFLIPGCFESFVAEIASTSETWKEVFKKKSSPLLIFICYRKSLIVTYVFYRAHCHKSDFSVLISRSPLIAILRLWL
uniref:Uncharacterized protein n=1 Tax=Malurus cyaneus samueli TaxID=2593467 RepID=A0A8C5X4Y8_9PASS